MQHLGPVIRQLGGFPGVQPGDHACIRHHPGIRGEQTRHVLPQRHALGFQGSSEQSGGQV
jgi:hypothetical protein